MNRLLVLVLLPFVLIQCKSKKIKLADEDTVVISDFIEFFPDIKLPFQMHDSLLTRKETDSASIGYRIFTQFVPDSVISKDFGAGSKPKIYPLGKVMIRKFETYLFLKAITASRKIGYILAFDKENRFIAALPLVTLNKSATSSEAGGMDAKYTVIKTVQKKSADGLMSEARNVFILNAEAQEFSLIMTDEGVADQQQDIINPIDTLAHNNKFSGDYIKDDRNYISIRDGKTPSNLLFFIHFEKSGGECNGELKGEAIMNTPKTALFRASGNPCVLEFTLTEKAVSLKELEACGSYRDIRCFFDGSYPRKKEPKAKASRKKQTGRK